MSKTVFIFVIVFLMSGILYACNQSNKDSVLPKLIAEGAILVDVRSGEEFAEGSVPGAINIPLDSLLCNIDTLNTGKHIIVFCRSGNRSGIALEMLRENNITDVTNGGSWQNVASALKESEKETEK